jgi:prolipoprotein diacylglyceryltransferase
VNAQQIVLAGPYNVFYAAAFAVAFLIAWRLGVRAGAKLERHSLFLVVLAVAGVLGSRFLPFDFSANDVGEKTVLGGLLAVTVVALAARRLNLIDQRSTNSLAIALLVGFAIGRVGCFLAGCCFGSATSLPWGVRYLPGTEPFAQQQALGLIDVNALSTHPVHPTQLYEAVGALLILCIAAIQLRRRNNDILIPVVVLPFLAMRFVLQFLRGNGGDFGVVHVMLIATAVVVWLMHSTLPHTQPAVVRRMRTLALLALPLTLFAIWFATPLELVTLLGIAAIAASVIMMRRGSPALRGSLPALASVIALQQAELPGDVKTRFITIGTSAMTGEYNESCGGRHEYGVVGASVAYTSIPNANSEISIKARLFTGTDDERPDSTSSLSVETGLGGGGIALHGRYKWIGGALGVVAGDLYFDGEPASALPVVAVTIGPPRFFVEGRFADFDPAPTPAPVLQIGVGTTITPEGSQIRAGISDAGFYASGRLVKSGWEIEPRLAFGDEDTHLLGLAIRKRFVLRQ